MLLLKAPLHSIRKTGFFRYLLKSRLNKPRLCNIGFDHKVALRPLTHASIRWNRNSLEPNIRKLICEVGRKLDLQNNKGWFFDVGANVGLYSWLIRKTCPNRKILAFEPDPKNFELLKTTIKSGGLENLELSPHALNNQSEEVCFFQDTLTSSTGTISKASKPWVEQYLNGSSHKIRVQSKTLDSLINENKIPSLLKIDVEGHEVEVLQGTEKVLSNARPLLFIESFPPNREKTMDLLIGQGYHLIDADKWSSVDENTHNLFAWHPLGPIEESTIRELISK